MKAQKLVVFVFSSLLALSFNAQAASGTWSGAVSNTWNNSSNWSAAFPSATTDIASFNTSGVTVTGLGQAISIGEIALTAASGNVTITDATNTLTLNSATPINIASSGILTLNVNTTFTTSTTSNSISAGTGTIDFGVGGNMKLTLTGTRALNFTSGTINIGTGATFTGNTSSSLNIENSGTVLNWDSTQASGTSNIVSVTNGGTMNIQLNGGEKITIGGTTGSAAYITATGITDSGVVQFSGGESSGTYILGSNITGTGKTAAFSSGIVMNNAGSGSFIDELFAATGNTLTLSGAASDHTGTVAGSYNVDIAGGGIVVLSNANTYVGTTQVETGATLQLGNNAALQDSTLDTSGAGVVTFGSGITAPVIGGLTGSTNLSSVFTTGYSSVTNLTLNPVTGVTDTYSGVIANGSMALTMSGAGTQILSGVNTYSGATAVNSGSLLIGQGGNIANSSGVTVAAGATFGTATTNTSATTLLTNAPALTLNMGSSTGGGSNLALNLYSGGTADTITAGLFTLTSGAGTVLVTVNDTTGNNLSGQYTLMSWTSTSGVTPITGDFTLAGNAATEGSLVVSGDDLFFDATAVPEPGTWAMMLGGLTLLVFVQCRRKALLGMGRTSRPV
jgi:fibronectin-binding autotransporter adhesin